MDNLVPVTVRETRSFQVSSVLMLKEALKAAFRDTHGMGSALGRAGGEDASGGLTEDLLWKTGWLMLQVVLSRSSWHM